MAAAKRDAASASVLVQFPQEQQPTTLDRIISMFSRFGDIARVDMTFAHTAGRILVTYFDIRNAKRVLAAFPRSSELASPAGHDFHAISLSSKDLHGWNTAPILPIGDPEEKCKRFGGFRDFGEIANVSVLSEDVVVHFYDMRAAQKVLCAVPGSRPYPPLQHSTYQADSVAAPSTPADIDWSPPVPRFVIRESSSPPQSYNGNSAGYENKKAVLSRKLQEFPSPGMMTEVGQGANSDSVSISTTDTSNTSSHDNGSSGKPVREKVANEDLTKYDIVQHNIENGEDLRTTVMVRKIPKTCTRETFVEVLAKGGLQEKYNFFYMPFDKRRSIHCGFAFVNFQSPADVLTLYQSMQTPLWLGLVANKGAAPPAVSYARLQGREQLMTHFSLSAVMYDDDARKRPVFLTDEYNSSGMVEGLVDEPHYVVIHPAPMSTTSPKDIAPPPGIDMLHGPKLWSASQAVVGA